MVYGIETFKKYFGSHLDRFVIIGGTACNMMRNLRLPMTADEMANHIRAIYLG